MDGAQKCRATEKKGGRDAWTGRKGHAGGEWQEEKMTTDEWAGGKSLKTTVLGERSRPVRRGEGRNTRRGNCCCSRRRGEKVGGGDKKEGIKRKKQSWRLAEQSGEAEGDTEMSSEDNGETFQAEKGRAAVNLSAPPA